MTEAKDILEAVAPKARANYVAAFKDPGKLLQRFGLITPLRLSHFLAQVLHETGGGRVEFENLSYTTAARVSEIFGIGVHSAAIRPEEISALLGKPEALAERVYGLGNPRKAAELGNLKKGDGYRYRGGGVLQTTGGGNYKRMSTKTGVDFYNDPVLIVSPEHALKPALFEWEEGNLNALADKNDIRTITRRINGGYNGLKERQAWFDRIWVIAQDKKPAAWQVASPDPDTLWLQESLNQLGADPQLITDGQYGPATTKAVIAFQKLNKLRADGVAGEVTQAAIRLRLAAIRGR